MSKLFARFWQDDEGAIISVELILILAILIFGIIPGLVALRNGVVAAFVNLANAIQGIVINVVVDGIGVNQQGSPAPTGIAGVGGFNIISAVPDALQTVGVPPTSPNAYGASLILNLSTVEVAPATLVAFP
jgi:Flp pilus assembly pilin Flp